MWVPEAAEQIERLARAGNLPETPSFDAKGNLPTPNRNSDLAVDVAAMSTDGGMLLYGVGEDEHKRPTVPQPIELAGAADRIGQIVGTSIEEVPYIDVREYPLDGDPARGYLAVIVPQSPRAPHQVTVGGDHRFYGRGATGNRRLTEGEVARLYQRRQLWEVDGIALLEETVGVAPLASHGQPEGFAHAFVRPVVPDQGIWDRAAAAEGGDQELHRTLIEAASASPVVGMISPSLARLVGPWRQRGADAWRLTPWSDDVYTRLREELDARDLVEVEINVDGCGRMFCGRATDRPSPNDQAFVMEVVIAGNVGAFFAMMAALYRAAGYFGQVDAGVAVTNVQGAGSLRMRGTLAERAYGAPTFTRVARWTAAELLDHEERTLGLLSRFFAATTGRSDYNPFSEGR